MDDRSELRACAADAIPAQLTPSIRGVPRSMTLMTRIAQRRVRHIGALALTAGLVAAACSSGSTGSNTADSAAAPAATEAPPAEPTSSNDLPVATEAPAATEAPTPTAAPVPPAPQALQFSAPLVGGGTIDPAAEFAGKPTVMWFWAPF